MHDLTHLPTKLSLQLLCDAFVREEVLGGRVFVVYGNHDTLRAIAAFMEATKGETDHPHYVLWGAIYTEDANLPLYDLRLGVFRHHGDWPVIDDWVFSANGGTLEPEEEPPPNAIRWARTLSIQ